MPSVPIALQRLEREIAVARQEKASLLKLIHGYGSSGVGGDLRVAIQRRLREMADAGAIQACIFGEDWSKSFDQAWKLLQQQPELKNDPDLGRGNCGITIVVL
ncbi:MAG TPA: Smr/MutS family protein [Candidatus Sulfotelmatobacter sp.]|nr:Smr/MutS family protein [Candidatus Sulfotelmatobacter sp.]